MKDVREEWEKEMYDDDHPSVEFAGAIILLAAVIIVFACGVFVGVWWR